MSCRYHYIFTNIVNSVQSLILYGHFQIFHRTYFMHIIAFNPRTPKTTFLPFILRCERYFTSAFDL